MTNLVAGIDIGSSTTRIVVARPPLPAQPPLVVGFGAAETEGVRRGYIVDSSKTEQSLKQAVAKAEKMVGEKIKRAYVAISGQSLSSDMVDVSIMISKGDGQITQFDIDALTEKAEKIFREHKKNKKYIHVIPIYFKLDGEEVMGKALGLFGTKLEGRFLFLSTLEHHFDELVHTVNQAGIDIIDIIAAPLAMSVAVLSAKNRTVGVGLLDVGSEITTLSLFENDRVLGVTTFPIGSLDVTNDIALGLKVSLDDAKEIKEEYLVRDFSHPKRKVAEIISARLSDIFEMTNKYLTVYKRKGLLPAGIVITGGGSMLAEIKTAAEATLELPVSLADMHNRFGRATKPLPDARFLLAYSLCFLDNDADPHFSNTFLGKVSKKVSRGIHSILEQFMP